VNGDKGARASLSIAGTIFSLSIPNNLQHTGGGGMGQVCGEFSSVRFTKYL